MTTLAQQIAEFVSDRDAVPEPMIKDSAGRVIDTLGNAIAALESTADDEPYRAVRRVIERSGAAPGAAEVLGTGERLSATSAAFHNGTLAHTLDFDDTHLPSVLHPSASVVPAALAAAQELRSSGREMLAAIALGGEVCNRLGMAAYDPRTRNSVFFEKGLHATSICGTVGAAVATAALLGLSASQTSSAMGIAASMGAGIIEANRTGGSVKKIHCGWAAQAGIQAAYLAAEGLTGPPTVFEGRFGFLRAYLDDAPDPEALVRGLGEEWEASRTVFKPYPSNHFTHPGIDCALELRRQGLDPSRITSIRLGVAAAPFRTIGEPRAEKIAPQSGYHAKFSGNYTVAAALVGGGGLGVYLDDFTDEAIADPERRRLAGATEVVVDDRCSELFPRAFAAVLDVWTDDGRHWTHRVDESRGGRQNPLTTEDLTQKFRLNVGRVLHEAEVADLTDRIGDIPAVTDMGALRLDAASALLPR